MPYKDPAVRREKQREINRAFVERHRSERPEGVCSTFPMCHNVAEGGFKKCAKCRAYMRQYKEGYRQQEAPEGVCANFPDCKNPADEGVRQCSRCRAKQATSAAKPEARLQRAGRRRDIKREAFDAYGGVCACCGEPEILFLTLDHIVPYDGTGPRASSALQRWLKARGYPPGFRVLCFSCNFSLGHHGYCPHSDLTQPYYLGSIAVPGQEEQRKKNQEYWRNYRKNVFSMYGGSVCSCCGENRNEFLTIEHTDRAGAAHRKEDPSAKNIYIWLTQHNFPDGYEILCLNCNVGRHASPDNTCPHTRSLTPPPQNTTLPP